MFHIHVPKASGGTVNVLFRQNNFLVLHFDMTTADFFANIPEHHFWKLTGAPPRQSYLLSGHFRLDHPIFVVLAFHIWSSRHWRSDGPDVVELQLHPSNAAQPLARSYSDQRHVVRDYAAKMYAAIGPQYSFFDDTGQEFAPTGTATVQECLETW